ncbi:MULTISPECIES: phosphoribosylamine--glycine ligase [Bacillaceae]|uniref:Phosphoribosylamine--glycine ligase n=1 Tax=Evansella alkalicola TaxID=745819 RepID=A0ABS6JRS2_9BACI|nr:MULTISPECIES: phosphoribosylamine--glycine ligase [Bacillaceae]MBU9721258.1 phosphoribosylamine--glycine ligase [Bacillus alkalicola]
MKLLVVGSGGREHAMCCKLMESKKTTKVFAAPGSDGMSLDGVSSTGISELDHVRLVQFAKEEGIDLTIVGPEVPLVNGVVDEFEAEGLRIFGPSKAAAQLEGSKEFAKKIMVDYNIPTAKYQAFSDLEAAKAYVVENGAPIVVKADGLAAGKGVVVAETVADALTALDEIMGDRAFGEAGSMVVIEECLRGEELSLMAFVSGETVVPMVPAQDHKRAFDGDAGPNTGGMGAYSPVPHIDAAIVEEAERTILRPMAKAMVAEGVPFTGILYAGLMVTEDGPKVIEFNARFGDPETQVVLPRLESDLVDVVEAVMSGEELALSWTEEACAGVVLASEGYPGSYEKGVSFDVPVNLSPGQKWYHAGTKEVVGQKGQWETNGGRVILLSSLGVDFKDALERTYRVLDNSTFNGLFYRSDIGSRALNASIENGNASLSKLI